MTPYIRMICYLRENFVRNLNKFIRYMYHFMYSLNNDYSVSSLHLRACLGIHLQNYVWGKSNFSNRSWPLLLRSFCFYLLDLHWNVPRNISNCKSNMHSALSQSLILKKIADKCNHNCSHNAVAETPKTLTLQSKLQLQIIFLKHLG